MDWKGVENCLHIKQCWFLLLCSIGYVGQSVAVSAHQFQSGQRIQQAKKSETSAVWLVEVIGGFRICQKNVDFKATAVTFG
jgi:hypothetical protein